MGISLEPTSSVKFYKNSQTGTNQDASIGSSSSEINESCPSVPMLPNGQILLWVPAFSPKYICVVYFLNFGNTEAKNFDFFKLISSL